MGCRKSQVHQNQRSLSRLRANLVDQIVVKLLYLMSFTRKKHEAHVTPKAKSDKADRVTKEETYRPHDVQKIK